MNFLNIAQTVRSLAGIQGTGPISVTDVQGIEAVLVQFVKDANIDLQNFRDDFTFMERSSTFTTIIDEDTYSASILVSAGSPGIKKYKTGSFILTDSSGKRSVLKHYEFPDEMERDYLNDTSTGIPRYIGVNSDMSLLLKPTPDAVYTVEFKYYREPQILSLNTDIPIIPVSFHQLIVYKALEKVAIYLSQPEIYRGYGVEVARLLGALMRDSIPKKRIQTRPMV